MTQTEVLKLALEALEYFSDTATLNMDKAFSEDAITAIKEALAQPEQEPVAWIRRHPNGALSNEVLIHVQVETVRRESGAWVPLYTTPPQRKPLTDEDAAAIAYKGFNDYWTEDCKGSDAEAWTAAARAIEAAHGIKE